MPVRGVSGWRKSSRSKQLGECVELWRKSSHSAQSGECVELAGQVVFVAFRDSKDPEGARLHLAPTAVASLISRIRAGRYDV